LRRSTQTPTDSPVSQSFPASTETKNLSAAESKPLLQQDSVSDLETGVNALFSDDIVQRFEVELFCPSNGNGKRLEF